MTTNEKDYSNYIQHMSNITSVLSLLAGFVFTSLTLLLALLPDPSSIKAQLILFMLTVLFDLSMGLMGWNTMFALYFCKNVPRRTKQLDTSNLLVLLSFSLFAAVIPLMFLLWNLVYLALVSGVVMALIVITNYIFTYKPLLEYRKTRARILGRVEKKEKYRD